MEPYTVRGTSRRESQVPDETQGDTPDSGKEKMSTQSPTEDWYHLVGVIVHSGQANAGHYYSFIKDRWYVYKIDQLSLVSVTIFQPKNSRPPCTFIRSRLTPPLSGPKTRTWLCFLYKPLLLCSFHTWLTSAHSCVYICAFVCISPLFAFEKEPAWFKSQ